MIQNKIAPVTLKDLVTESNIRKISIVAWRDLDDITAGGSEIHAHEIAKRWAEAGLDVTMRTASTSNNDSVSIRNGYKVVRKSSKYNVFGQTLASGFLGRMPESDVLVEIWNGMPFLSPLWSRGPRVVILHHVHEKALWRSVLPLGLADLGAYFERKIAPKFYRNTRVITPSTSSANEVIDLLGWPDHQVNVVHPGVNSRFRPQGPKNDRPLIFSIGRLVEVKRYDWVIRAVDEVRRRVGDVQLVIAGEGAQKKQLNDLVSDLKATSWCKLIGKISDEELVRYYRRSWAVVSASMREGWGMTLTEAGACGTLSLASRIPGHMDAVVDGETGYLFDTLDQLVDYLETVINDRELARRLSVGALRHSSKLTWDAAATRAFQILDRTHRESTGQIEYLLPKYNQLKVINRRAAERIFVDLPIKINDKKGKMIDISSTGALIAPIDSFWYDYGDLISAEVDVDSGILGLDGTVVRHSEQSNGVVGFGVWFNSQPKLLNELLNKLSQEY